MKMTLRELASLIGARIEGDETMIVKGFGPLDEAGEGFLTFLANPKYTHLIYNTRASAVLVSEDFVPEKPIAATMVRVKDPYATLAELMTLAQRMTQHSPVGIELPCRVPEGFELPEDAYVGAFAYVSDDVQLGKGVKVYPQVYIGPGCVIGEGTVLNAGVRIYPGCRIGKRCIIHSGAVIGADGFGFAPTASGEYEKIPQLGHVEIADDVEIGANTTIDRATFGATCIGQGTKIDNLVQVAHNVHIGRNNVFAAQGGVAGSTRIGDSNMVGGQVGFAGHITVGDRNQFGAQSGIPNNVGSDNALLGYPAIEARQFAKNQVYIKKLGKLFEQGKL
jgi:UDP-3-O-[3-hydroxymyristoyl] glucosamine N-acyltransferase